MEYNQYTVIYTRKGEAKTPSEAALEAGERRRRLEMLREEQELRAMTEEVWGEDPAQTKPKRNRKIPEADPTGRDPHEPGAKLDVGKLRVGLVLNGFPRALEAVAEVATHGAAKYTEGGWQTVPDGVQRYEDAMLRHLLKQATGERDDPDSGLLHMAHAAWNVLAVLELMLRDARG